MILFQDLLQNYSTQDTMMLEKGWTYISIETNRELRNKLIQIKYIALFTKMSQQFNGERIDFPRNITDHWKSIYIYKKIKLNIYLKH